MTGRNGARGRRAFTISSEKLDTPPVVTVTNPNIKASAGQILAASSLFTASDPDGDAITQYDFWDTGGGGGHFLVNGVTQPTNGDIYVTASQLAQTTYQSGAGTDTLWVRANDGSQWSAWSPSFTVSTAKVDTPPVVTVTNPNITASAGQILAASSLFTASDPDGDAITQYDFWDTGWRRRALSGQRRDAADQRGHLRPRLAAGANHISNRHRRRHPVGASQ